MQTVPIQTAQNVTIEYETAGVGERILAAMVDYIIIFSYAFAIFFAYLYIEKYIKDIAVVYFILLALPVVCYDLICEIAMDGQSFGKKLIGIKVVKLDGTQPSVSSYLLRWILRIIDISFLWGAVAVLTILLNGKGQRLGDIAAGTTVIRLKQSVKISDTILVPIDDNYRPAFPEAGRLDVRTVTIIKEVLDFAKKNRRTRAAEDILARTKAKLEGTMGVTSRTEPKEFLEAVLKDYNYYQGK
jgi:uncharacterized RDD family membrane protein YckC